MNTGDRISRMRKARGLTQDELGEKMGVSFQSVSSWERGESMPDTPRLVALAQALGTSVGYLLNEDGVDLPLWERLDRVFSEERMHTFIKATAVAKGLHDTIIALKVSQEAHAGQTRKGGNVPYINHPLGMACHALAMNIEEDHILAAILLHDVVEDCPGYAADSLPVSETVRTLVDLLTHTWPAGGKTESANQAYYARIAGNPDACFVKTLDRCNNLSLMVNGLSKPSMIAYIQETESYVLPLLELLKHSDPRYNKAAFLLKYQMLTLMETVKRLLQ